MAAFTAILAYNLGMSHYRTLRRSLAKRLAGQGVVHLQGGKPVPRNFDVDYAFRQNSDFLYLTGVEEPGCHLVLDGAREILLVPRVDAHHRVWEGHVPGPAEAKRLFGVDKVMYADELKKAMGGRKPVAAAKLRDALDEMRAVKTEGELHLMRRANAVSGAAHAAVMKAVRPGLREYELQAIFDAACLREGLKHLAYPSIVATGVNSAVLHYRRNNSLLKAGTCS